MTYFATVRVLTASLLYFALFEQGRAQVVEKECEIHGLPQESSRKGNIHFLEFDSPFVKLSLSCRCSIYQPLWQEYLLETQELLSPFSRNEKCMNTTSGQPCQDQLTYLPERTPGIVLYNDETFIIKQSTMLMCYSGIVRLAVVVTVSDLLMTSTISSSSRSITSEISYFQSSFDTSARTTHSLSPSATTESMSSSTSQSTSRFLNDFSESTSQPPTSTSNHFQASTQLTETSQETVTVHVIPTFVAALNDSTVERHSLLDKIGIPTLVVVPLLIIALVIIGLLLVVIFRMRSRNHNKAMETEQHICYNIQPGNSLDRLLPASSTELISSSNNIRNLRKSQSSLTFYNLHSIGSVQSL